LFARTRPVCVRPLTSARICAEGRTATNGRTSLDDVVVLAMTIN